MNIVFCTGSTTAFETWLASQGGNVAQADVGARQTRFRVTSISESLLSAYAATHPEISFEMQNPPPQKIGKTPKDAAIELRAQREGKSK